MFGVIIDCGLGREGHLESLYYTMCPPSTGMLFEEYIHRGFDDN